MASFRIQKVLNYKPLRVGGWRTYTHGYDRPYNWADEDGFGVESFQVGDADHISVITADDGNYLWSDYFNIQNDEDVSYTLSLDAKAAANSTLKITIEGVRENGTEFSYLRTASMTTSWQTFTWTLGAADANNISLADDMVGIRLKLWRGASEDYNIRNIKILGEQVTLDKGFFMPLPEDEMQVQEINYNAAKSIVAKTSWQNPVKVFKLNRSGWRQEDYTRIWDFLNSPDIRFGKHPCLFTDDTETEYWGRFVIKSINFRAKAHQNALINLTFMELAY